MELNWYGHSCFRLKERKHATIVTDPYDDTIGLPPLKLKGDVVTISHDAKGHNYAAGVSGHQHVLIGPGEYEIGNVFITAIVTVGDDNSRRNILYVYDFNGLTIAHVGDIQKVPKQAQIEALEEVNVLLVPVGGGKSLNAAAAAELVSMLEPNIVVPMHYQLPGLSVELDSVDRFLKEMGVSEPTEESTLKLAAGNLPEGTEIVLLSPRD